IPVLREQKVNGLTGLIHGPIQIPPLPLHPNIGLIQPPAGPDWALAAVKRLFQLGTVCHDPALDRRVVDRHPALLHEFFDMPIAPGVSHRPAHAQENDILWKMGSLEAHRHRLAPSHSTRSHREGSYPKSTQMKTCDRAVLCQWSLQT